tara:strand:- start:1280 stop:1615 length:336 start_codon:yes stop_codon:yes gene_type:complete
MAIPIAITGSFFFNDIELTSSYARVISIESPLRVFSGTNFTGSYDVSVFYNSESFALYKDGNSESVNEVDNFIFSYLYKFDENDPDPVNQVYGDLIASQSAFSGMTKKIYS